MTRVAGALLLAVLLPCGGSPLPGRLVEVGVKLLTRRTT